MPNLSRPFACRVRRLLPLAALFFAATTATSVKAAARPEIVYRWDAASWLTKYNQVQFTASPLKNPDGTTGARVAVSAHSANNPYNFIVVSGAGLKGGNEYTAAITFTVQESPVFPCAFCLFARNSSGNQHDIWQGWTGLPGETRTITVPLSLKDIPGGDWKLFMGIEKSGALDIHSLIVYSGTTSDGARNYVTVPAATSGSPVSSPSKNVTPATGFKPFTLIPPAAPAVTISLSDYHLVPDGPTVTESTPADNAAALDKAIADCKGKGAVKLLIPKGSYHVSTVRGLMFNMLEDLTVDGGGSTLIFKGLTKEGPAINFSSCNRVLVKDLNIDWDWTFKPIASLGKLSNFSADRLQGDFTFPGLDAAQTETVRTTPWKAIFGTDLADFSKRDPNNYHVPKEIKIDNGSAANVLHVTFPAPAQLTDGATYCIRHLYYEMGGYKISSCTDINFENDNIYAIPGMGWFFGAAMHNFQLKNCNIIRPPGAKYPYALTTAADGFHVDQFVDNMNVENCSITGTGDDAMNIHTEVYQGNIVLDKENPAKMTLLECPAWQLRLKPGDPIEFYNGDFSPLKGGTATKPVTGTVASTSSVNSGKRQTVIEFTAPIPKEVTPLSILNNGRYKSTNVRISGCKLYNSAGRGILLSARDAVIENCSMINMGGNGINLESDIFKTLWTEGPGASNIVIRNNHFETCNISRRDNGAVIYTHTRFPWGQTKATLYDGVTIENNHFVNPLGPVVSLMNCANLLVRGNEIELNKPVQDADGFLGMLYVTQSSGVSLGGNRWINTVSGNAAGGGVIYDPATTTDLSTGTNVVQKGR